MSKDRMGRRDAVRHLLVLSASVAMPTALLAACKGESSGGGGGGSAAALSCTDTAGLTPDEIKLRTDLTYADKSADATKTCEKCNFFKSGGAGKCGSCTIVKGGINPAGSCKSYAPKVPT